MRRTKIVATLGPATDRNGLCRELARFVDVFRLNASHGAPEDHQRRIQEVRALARELGRDPAILLDLQGPKIRLGRFENGAATLEKGSRFRLTTEEVLGTAERASTTYPEFARDVRPGDRVLLADGSVELRVLSSNGQEAVCEVVTGGPISDRKGINLPGVNVSTPSLTKKDIADLRWGIEAGIDIIALSFVRRREDIYRLKVYLDEHEARIPVVAKIEKPEAVDRMDEIIDEADGVMVARGDLGVEVALEKVPFIQKSIIERARHKGKFVITATQMLESMIQNPFPTRAEVSDIANAIYDGTDAVMLSAETSAGQYPAESAAMMSRIAEEAELSLPYVQLKDLRAKDNPEFPDIIADAAFRAARTLKAAAIVVFTSTGRSAFLAASYRPSVPIYAFTPNPEVARQMQVIYGVRPIFTQRMETMESMFASMDDLLCASGRLKPGDTVVMMAGSVWGQPGSTSLLKLHEIHGQ
jgi:pyruvate kinase